MINMTLQRLTEKVDVFPWFIGASADLECLHSLASGPVFATLETSR